jgi:MFS family permease
MSLVGFALGAYGLTQACLQILYGTASDRFGRKPVIVFGLVLFIIGSFVAALAGDIYGVIAGRVLQGAGAISAAVTALAADLTREQHRTKVMAMIGSSGWCNETKRCGHGKPARSALCVTSCRIRWRRRGASDQPRHAS